MKDTLFSPSWYRVGNLKPRLRGHVEIHRHTYRRKVWYVLEDRASGRFQRFTPAAHLLIGLMNGERTVEEIWHVGRSRLGDDAPSQEEMIHLLSQLHAADVLQSDISPDSLELLKRFERKQKVKWKQNIRNPLAMRFPLFDPERFLNQALPLVRPLLGWPGVALWLIIVGIGVILAGVHWPELTKNVSDHILAPTNLIVLWLTFPLVKAVHEFGHAFAIKRFGGEVHEMGVMLLVFTPLPYVDASSALAFRSKWERILVGAAGIAVEFFIAAVALILWVNAEPGAMRSTMYTIILLAGLSSVLFNGNPLLRYDGYYILADLLEIPNLGPRGSHYLAYLVQRYAFGVQGIDPPPSTQGERAWFVVYAVLSLMYRIFIYIAIIQFIAGKFFTLGLLLALWAAVSMIGLPLVKGLKFIFSSRLAQKRTRVMGVTTATAGIIVILTLLLPVPLSTIAEGVLWFPEESFVRARTDGFVEQLVAATGQRVKPGDLLVHCSDPLLVARVRVLEAHLRDLQVQHDMKERSDRVQALVTLDEISQVKRQLEDARSRAEELSVFSRAEGVFFAPTPQDLPGRFLKRGEVIGYVLNKSDIIARAVVSQADVDLVRTRTRSVKVRLPEKITRTLPASLVREVPAGTEHLPARVLSQAGGGEVPIDPRDEKGVRAYRKVFLFDVHMPPQSHLFNVEGRVYVRFNHGFEPLAWRWGRAVRQVLLRRFNV